MRLLFFFSHHNINCKKKMEYVLLFDNQPPYIYPGILSFEFS